MYSNQFDGGGGAALFSGGGFMPSQATQTPESSFSKSRATQTVLPLIVKQINEAYHSNDDKSNFVVDGVEISTVELLGRVVNRIERVTDVSFTLDDCTGRIDVNRWVNETSDTNEMAKIQNGMYVKVYGNLKGFQGKRHVVAFCVRPVVDFNDITHHFLECLYVHLENTRPKLHGGGPLQFQGNATTAATPIKGYQTQISNQLPTHSAMGARPANDIRDLVLNIFQEPASLTREHGLHVDEVIRRLGLPVDKIKDAIEYHVDVGNIYSTIDEYHYKSACNG
ncbi:replication protein A 32 kDa subunit B-like [Typha angustifolia]|uniref:replication protein A 32 kDa subunit B-like n=1 Tax=Typha angustifolia TaxID=59011 RepID=UPI003C2B6634